uniref:Retrotransposon Copia-like N-terminal domain-containing protein n=1 Tax=Cannabis sativa TaxID=3483 RepID=A0A803QN75_CANSA
METASSNPTQGHGSAMSDNNNSTPASSVTPATTNSSWNPFSNSLTSSLTIKLDRTNYLAWKSQVVPTVIGHDLDEILFNNIHPPPTLITRETNPNFKQWKKRDQLLLSWLRSSMSEGILGSVAAHSTSFEVWKSLEQKFSGQSKARLLQLKSQLTNIQKGNMSISDYVDKIKSICDNLAIVGCIVNDQDIELQLLNGLGPEYDSVVSGITSTNESKSLEEIQALLMAHECRLERHHSVSNISNKMAANLAVGNSRTGYNSSRNGNFRPFFQQNRSNEAARNPNNFPPRYLNSNSRPICQVCLKVGHTASVCHYRFDKNFVTPKNNSQSPKAYLAE